MAAKVVELREAVADWIDAGTYPYEFSLVRANWGLSDLATTNLTQVWVYPSPEGGRQAIDYTRAQFHRSYMINVHVVNFLDQNTQDEIDNMLDLVELLENRLWAVEQAGWQFRQFDSQTTGRNFFEIEQVHQRNRFHSITGCLYSEVA